MPPLTIVSSDRPSSLIERLALDLGQAPLDPFATETIVVQSRGTERWVRHELAARHGCAAGLSFPFAASFFRTLSTALLPGVPASADNLARATSVVADRLEGDALTWRILELLENGIAEEPDFEPLRAFVGPRDQHDTRKLLGLASAVAARFEEYQLYRPELFLDWESDDAVGETRPHARWQTALWRRLSATNATVDHVARFYMEATDILNGATETPTCLPTRLSVFGVNTLPPAFVKLLHAVARHVPVRLYLQAPPRATWVSASVPNPLWATFGCVTQELVSLLDEHAPGAGSIQWEELHGSTSGSSTILGQLQADIRSGASRGPQTGLASPIRLDADKLDESLVVHHCHSPMREMEVLRDQLLAAFAADPTLRPHDVLVLLPDVATYGPFVEAVFGVGEQPYIPHHIADRPIAVESRLADAALRILRLVGARWTAAEVMELLDLPAIQRAAGLGDGAPARILQWIEETSIRWGRDGAMRKEIFGLPSIDANSWRAGVDRLLMGYATGRTSDLVDDVLPHSGDTIGEPETLGAFAAFTEGLFDTLSGWRTARTLAEWSVELRAAFTRLLAAQDEDEECDLDVVLGVVDRLATLEADGGAARAFELPVVRDWLEKTLSDESLSSGFLAGGITFCAFKPMRVVPHRIIVMVGLDDATFPRRHQRPAFDLIAAEPREGDRDRRADDRQLFLDTLLASGDRFILSYVARSAKTNVERAASVAVAELLDVVDASFVHPTPDTPARAAIEVRHHLQPFSPGYFAGDARLFSYSAVKSRALTRIASGERTSVTPFWSAPLPTADVAIAREIRLEDLIDCWTNPSRFFCVAALGIRLPGESTVLEECEPMKMNKLDEYKVNDVMLRRYLMGQSRPDLDRAEAIALGQLPSGALAGVWYDHLRDELTDFLDSIGEQEFDEPVAICIDGPSWSLVGRIDGITGAGRLQVRPANCSPKDVIRAWITHLALTAEHGPVETFLVGKDARWTFGEVAEPGKILDELIEGYRTALREPLPFFTAASHAYAQQTIKFETGNSRVSRSPLDAARTAFDGSDYGDRPTGDSSDAYVTLAWRGRDPFESVEPFDSLSMKFWRPALAAMTDATKVEA